MRVILSLILFPMVALAAGIPAQNIVKGQSSTLQTSYDVGNVAVTDPKVCDFVVQASRREIYLNAKGTGRTMLTIWDTSGVRRDEVPISVSSQDMAALSRQAEEVFGKGTRLQILDNGNQVMLAGEVTHADELEKMDHYLQQNPQIKSAVRMGPGASAELAHKIEEAIAIPGIRVRMVQGRLLLEGSAYGNEAAARAEKIAKLFDPNIMNLIEIRDGKRRPGREAMVALDIYFMEVKKEAIRSLGITWSPGATPQGAQGGGALGNLVGSAVGTVFNLLPKLKLVRESGSGRILEHPNLVVKSGEVGELFSGTQVPYFSRDSVQFKEVGIKVNAEPIASGGAVDLKLTASLSSLSAGVNQGIDTRSLNTVAYCKAGESVVLGGLYRNADATTWNKLPQGVDTSSALFSLALSRDFQSSKSELLIFVTPRIVETPSVATEAMQKFNTLDGQITKKRSRREWRELNPVVAEQEPGKGAKVARHAEVNEPVVSIPDALKPAGGAP